jgi:hypothetical protein
MPCRRFFIFDLHGLFSAAREADRKFKTMLAMKRVIGVCGQFVGWAKRKRAHRPTT